MTTSHLLTAPRHAMGIPHHVARTPIQTRLGIVVVVAQLLLYRMTVETVMTTLHHLVAAEKTETGVATKMVTAPTDHAASPKTTTHMTEDIALMDEMPDVLRRSTMTIVVVDETEEDIAGEIDMLTTTITMTIIVIMAIITIVAAAASHARGESMEESMWTISCRRVRRIGKRWRRWRSRCWHNWRIRI